MLLMSLNAMAVVPIKKGEISPVDGFVFSKEEEQNLRLRDTQQQFEVDKLKKLGEINEKIIQEREYQVKKQDSFVNNTTLWFVLGIVATGFAVKMTEKR